MAKQKKFRFTSKCYGVMAAIDKRPNIVLRAAEKLTAGRLVDAGLLVKKDIMVEQVAGTFKYVATCEGFELSEQGRERYEMYKALVEKVKSIPQKDLRVALDGEEQADRILSRAKLNEKVVAKFLKQ